MAVINGTRGISDTIDVSNNVGTLNGSGQGSPITDINMDAFNTTLTISNSTILGTVSQDGGFLDADFNNTTIGTLDLSNDNASIDMTNVSILNGGDWGAGARVVNWTFGNLGGDIRAGAGNDTVTMTGVGIDDNITIDTANGNDSWTFDNTDIGSNFTFRSGASNTIVNIVNDTSFGPGASFDTGNGSFDQLNLPEGTVVTLDGEPGTYTVGTDTFPSGINFDGSFTLPNGSSATFSAFDSFSSTGIPVCFTPGTKILVPSGEEVPVETLSVGDLVMTADNGAVPIRWIGKRDMVFVGEQTKHKPILIKQGALGDNLPTRDLAVSPQHCVVISGALVEQMFDTQRVLVRAKGLIDLPGVRQMKGKPTTQYHTLLLDQHQIIRAEGAWSESLYPGPVALNALPAQQRQEIETIFPKLKVSPEFGYGGPACRVLSVGETVRLATAMQQGGAQPIPKSVLLSKGMKIEAGSENSRANLH